MRRTIGVVTGAALALTLLRAGAFADSLALRDASPDIASQLMLRLFGETADTKASFSAQSGDRSSESPLRELALRVNAPGAGTLAPDATATLPAVHIAFNDFSVDESAYLYRAADAGVEAAAAAAATSLQTPALHVEPLSSQSPLYTAAYQPVTEPSISPGPGTIAFDGGAAAAPSTGLGVAEPSLDGTGKTTKHPFSLNLSGHYDRTDDLSAQAFTADTTPSLTLPGPNSAFTVPNYAGSNRLSLGAGLAVPVFHGLTLNLNYDAQRSYGSEVLPGVTNFDAANNLYAGRLTYQIPYSSSSLSISAYQNRPGDSLLPVNGYTQTGENVNFTVKF